MFRNLKAMSVATTGLLVMSLATLSIGAQTGGVAAGAAKSNYVIGVPLPMTGAEAASGAEIFKAEELAAAQVNAAGGIMGHKVTLIEEDSACDATTAANAANLLVTKHVNAIVGEYCSTDALPEEPIFSRAGLPVIFAAANSPALLSFGYKDIFLALNSAAEDSATAAAFFKQDLKKTSIAVVDDQSAFGVAIADSMQADLKTAGMTLAGGSIQAVPNTLTDFSSVIAAIKSSGATGIFWTGYYAQAALFVKQLAAAGVTAPFVGDSAAFDPTFITGAGSAANGTYVDSAVAPSGPALTKFTSQYKAKFHSAPGPYSAYGYDGIKLMALAARQAKSITASKVIAALHKTKYVGVTGKFTFAKDGDRTGVPEEILTVTNGAYVKNSVQPKL
jgi:branched-chain amino acid transport system substrate-binding protein